MKQRTRRALPSAIRRRGNKPTATTTPRTIPGITLRQDQLILVEQALEKQGENTLIVSPSGSGKTYLLAYLEHILTKNGKTVYAYAPTIEVREQIDKLFKRTGSENYTRSIVRDLNDDGLLAPDYLLIDEAHHSEADSYQALYEKFPQAVRIGFSATPKRLDGKGLDNSYDHIILSEAEIVAGLLLDLKNKKSFTDHLGNEFPSLAAMARRYDIHPETLRIRLARGWALEEALQKRKEK